MSTQLAGNPFLSPADIERLSRPKFQVFNPGPDPDVVEVAGHFYSFAPNSPANVSDQYTYPVTNTDRGRRPDFGRRELTLTAAQVAAYICSPEFRGEKGFCVLVGDGHDEQRMAAARHKYRTWRIAKARATQMWWLNVCKSATTEPGAVAPVQPMHVRADMDYLRKYQLGLVDRKPFVCRIDGHETDTREEMLVYMKEMYPAEPVDPNITEVRGARAEVVPEEPVAAPPLPAVSEDGMLLIQLAQNAKFPLSMAEKKLCRMGDMETLADITTRMQLAASGE